jgi:hypothetical protein
LLQLPLACPTRRLFSLRIQGEATSSCVERRHRKGAGWLAGHLRSGRIATRPRMIGSEIALCSRRLMAPKISPLDFPHRDISERKRAEEALRASEERYRSLFTSTLMAVFVFLRPERRYSRLQSPCGGTLRNAGFSIIQVLRISAVPVCAIGFRGWPTFFGCCIAGSEHEVVASQSVPRLRRMRPEFVLGNRSKKLAELGPTRNVEAKNARLS